MRVHARPRVHACAPAHIIIRYTTLAFGFWSFCLAFGAFESNAFGAFAAFAFANIAFENTNLRFCFCLCDAFAAAPRFWSITNGYCFWSLLLGLAFAAAQPP